MKSFPNLSESVRRLLYIYPNSEESEAGPAEEAIGDSYERRVLRLVDYMLPYYNVIYRKETVIRVLGLLLEDGFTIVDKCNRVLTNRDLITGVLNFGVRSDISDMSPSDVCEVSSTAGVLNYSTIRLLANEIAASQRYEYLHQCLDLVAINVGDDLSILSADNDFKNNLSRCVSEQGLQGIHCSSAQLPFLGDHKLTDVIRGLNIVNSDTSFDFQILSQLELLNIATADTGFHEEQPVEVDILPEMVERFLIPLLTINKNSLKELSFYYCQLPANLNLPNDLVFQGLQSLCYAFISSTEGQVVSENFLRKLIDQSPCLNVVRVGEGDSDLAIIVQEVQQQNKSLKLVMMDELKYSSRILVDLGLVSSDDSNSSVDSIRHGAVAANPHAIFVANRQSPPQRQHALRIRTDSGGSDNTDVSESAHADGEHSDYEQDPRFRSSTSFPRSFF